MSGIRSARDLLRGVPTRLIAEIVTGKLDAREAAAQLPDEAEEPEPLDEAEVESGAEGISNGGSEPTSEEAAT